MFGFEGIETFESAYNKSATILDSSAVEHSAVNRRVVGSNPTRGVINEVFLRQQETLPKKN